MELYSTLPPISFKSVVSGQWYIITTGRLGKWLKVDRKYDWEEIKMMWKPDEFTQPKEVVVTLPKKVEKQTFSVEGSKGKIYEVINNGGRWSCTCPALSLIHI